nr:cyclin-dependent protein kinase regulator [Naematelia aurantialba]
MDDDWDVEESPVHSGASTPAPVVPVTRAAARSKWQGEDEEEEQDDWDASEDEKPKAPTTAVAAPVKKKGGLKQKLAEKERLAAEARARGELGDDLIDTTTEQDRRRQARERELEADLNVAADLLGVTGVDDSRETLKAVLESKPASKDGFATLSKQIVTAIIARHESNPLFPAFVETFAKDLCESLTAVQTRKVASGLSTLGNTKQQEERDRASGKKKTTAKPKLGAVKSLSKDIDTEAYNETYDDGDDFM